VIRAVGLIPAGGNYDHIQRRVRELKLDTSHFTRQAWAKGKTFKRYPIERALVANRPIASYHLKLRLIREGIKEERCELCGWAQRRPCDGAVPVELDHKNGDKSDNRLVNLRVVCPLCRARHNSHYADYVVMPRSASTPTTMLLLYAA
jgi:hypothetical protein